MTQKRAGIFVYYWTFHADIQYIATQLGRLKILMVLKNQYANIHGVYKLAFHCISQFFHLRSIGVKPSLPTLIPA